MWPFRKRTQETVQEPAKSILCIPGPWADYEDFHRSLMVSSGAAYMVVGNILFNGKEQRHFNFEFCERDEKMRESFSVAGRPTGIAEDTLEEISKHKYVVYISCETAGLLEAENIARAGMAILEAGGIALKVESTGKGFSKNLWLTYMDNFSRERALYDMFVLDSITEKDGTVFSCGMHNLGLPDSIVSNEEFQNAVNLLRIFGLYQIVDKPTIKNNQTFRKDLESPIYRISYESDPPYKGDETFDNPYGMWRLTRVAE